MSAILDRARARFAAAAKQTESTIARARTALADTEARTRANTEQVRRDNQEKAAAAVAATPTQPAEAQKAAEPRQPDTRKPRRSTILDLGSEEESADRSRSLGRFAKDPSAESRPGRTPEPAPEPDRGHAAAGPVRRPSARQPRPDDDDEPPSVMVNGWR